MKMKLIWILTFAILIGGSLKTSSQTNYQAGNYQIMVNDGHYFNITNADTAEFLTNKLLIKLKESLNTNERNSFSVRHSLTEVKSTKTGITLYSTSTFVNFISLLNDLSIDDDIEFFDLNYIMQYQSNPPTNDSYDEIWAQLQLDPGFLCPYEKPELFDAWSISTGSSEIIIGNLDNGIFLNHEDLGPGPDSYSNIWKNINEIPNNGIDDDYNGYIDDYYGWDFGSSELGDNDVSHIDPLGFYHGTTSAGIMAAKTNNNIGGFGVAGGWNGQGVRVMSVKTSTMLGLDEIVESACIPFAIEYACNNGARIINMPFSVNQNVSYIENTIYNYYVDQRIVFLAASGQKVRSQTNNGVAFPALLDDVIAVGGTVTKGANCETYWHGTHQSACGHPWTSFFGPELEISAPVNPSVMLTVIPDINGNPTSGYRFIHDDGPCYAGTSWSVAFASGIVGLMLSVDACLTNEEIREILRDSADKIPGCQAPYYDYSGDGHCDEIGYGRINARAAVEACIPYPDQNVTSNVTWNTYMRIDGNVTVEDGGELTIGPDAIIKFHPYNKILVKKGGRLIVDGGTITTGCGDFWEGIEVHGDPALPQVPSSNQGYVQVKNNGKIENALCAIRLFSPDEYRSGEDMPLTGNDGGGIAKCLDSRFINNKLALDIRYYPNIKNQSTFNNCLFEINDDYLKKNKDQNGNYTTPKFDLMTNLVFVNGIDFNACNFKVKDYESWDFHYFGKAINCINSNFNVKPLCLESPCEDNPPYISTFSGFNYAIYVVNTSNLSNFSVEQSEFLNNYSCIYASSILYAKILKNKFSIHITEQFPELENRLASGLYLNECTGYHIEGNEFTGISEDIFTENVGVYIKNSGPSTNYVYNNTFQRLDYGSIAEGYNCNDDGTLQGTGLCYKCNDFSQMHYDIFVANPKSIKETPYGIRAFQGFRSEPNTAGADTAAAGNVFSQNGTNRMNILNEGKYEIQYFYHELTDGGVQPEWLVPVRKDYVTPHRNEGTRYTKSISCKSWIGKSIPLPEKLMTDYLESSLTEATSKEAIIQLKDGGNTETVIETIENSYPDEAFVLRDDLLSKSPYLSDVTLKSAIEKEDVLTNALLRDILTSNPQAGKSEAILIKLDEKAEPMPDEMYLEILESAENPSPYNMLLEDYAQANHDRSLAFNNLVETFIADTLVENSQQQLENLVETDQSVQAELLLIKYYLDKGLFQDATNRVVQLQLNLPVVTNIALIQGQLTGYLNIYIPALTDTLFILDTTSKQLLGELSIQGEYPLDSWSKNLLEILTSNYQSETYVLPADFENKKIRVRPVTSENSSDQKLYLYPNPASTHFVVRYSIPEITKNATLRVTTIDGRLVHEYPLIGFDNEKVIRINDLPEAVYNTELIADGKRIANTKLTIVH
ncbi:MAG: S8 family serine peptidase [Lentimicrobium sp.]